MWHNSLKDISLSLKPNLKDMIASVQYDEFKGTAAADISDVISKSDGIEDIARFFKLDFNRFKPVGISIYGVKNCSVSLICVDKEKSTLEKEYIVSMLCELDKNGKEEGILANLFKRLNIVLYNKFDNRYPNLNYDAEVIYDEFHKSE